MTHLCPSICSPFILADQIIKSYGWFSKRLKVGLYSNSQFVNLFDVYTYPSFQRLVIQESLWRLCFIIICSFRLFLSYCCNLLLSGQHELELYFWFLSLRIQRVLLFSSLLGNTNLSLWSSYSVVLLLDFIY